MVLPVALLLSSQLLLLPIHIPSASAFIPRGYEVTNAVGRPQLKIYHPPSGSCIFRQHYEDLLKLAPCEQSDSWKYTPQKFLTVSGTYYCLKADGPGRPAKLSIACDVSDSQWTPVSESQTMHLATQMENGNVLCLDVDDNNTIVTNSCRSFSSDAKVNEGDSQWFQIRALNQKKD